MESGLTKADSKKAVDAFMSTVANALKQGDKVALVGFGSFTIVEKGERQGINPATRAAITIPAKKVIKFKAAAELTENLE